MLVLRRKVGESLFLFDEKKRVFVVLRVVKEVGERAKIGVEVPSDQLLVRAVADVPLNNTKNHIVVRILKDEGSSVKIGVEAPPHILIQRGKFAGFFENCCFIGEREYLTASEGTAL
ncbi:carbon storage regulator CsrA [Thermosporothrix hazakensis]|jgi:sRNA-binding carbon storage regulator CsrA|uniref:Carbon storage regulator CsrA n=2 Tax=Thermosporothrix TaxID=768650 RepID=A0A326U272_THEHA|nr:carbon storage regulator [Thermosporothrix hazakensis]PZW25369.1 carbon storage regulator CsrA [Thermosporothrix hazakensis]BBH87212.1 hypothetical protein KTC_19630 [Thermosporothrix sp. COM3]GCE50601.1 hypothetical protein KTH_54700 [Thermosporothrix hazakensis]